MAEARIEAVKFLTKIEKDQSYSALTLGDGLRGIAFSDPRDVAFTVSLVYGVLEHKLTLDYNISLYLTSRLSKLKKDVLNIIRVGAYQILYMDKIPDSAAVNEAVKTTKKLNSAYASGMVNAILRKISLNGICLPDKDDIVSYLSVSYSVDPDIVRLMAENYGYEVLEDIFGSFSGRRPIYVRCNTVKCTSDELISSLCSDGVNAETTSLAGCIAVEATGDISALTAYKNGWFHVQDMSSQLCCRLLDAKPGDTVIDCCAAPGGKSFTVAQYLKNKGKIISCDMYEHKTKLIADGAKRLGINNLEAICSDARDLYKHFCEADKVLCDVPCSGLGVMGRKPEIRYKSVEEINQLPEIQKSILYSCAEMVKKGGTLIYSTCTLNKNENENICEEFLREFTDFSVAKDDLYSSFTDRFITLFPEKDSGDGFFIAKFIRG